MKHQRSCDAHTIFRAGCLPCQKQEKSYRVSRARATSRRSASADLVSDWLRQLRAAGYPIPRLVAETGLNRSQIVRLSSNDRVERWVQLRTFHAVQAAYLLLRDFPGGDLRAARWAAKCGWTPPPPLPMPDDIPDDYVDEIAVERALNGERVPLTKAEKLTAWERLEAQGLAPDAICRRIGVAPKTVDGWRTRMVRPYRRTSA